MAGQNFSHRIALTFIFWSDKHELFQVTIKPKTHFIHSAKFVKEIMRQSEKSMTKWRKARLRMDLGQKEFAQKLGVGAGYISEIESGKKEPSYTLAELFRYVCQEEFGEAVKTDAGESTLITNQTTSKREESEIEMLKDDLILQMKRNQIMSDKNAELSDANFALLERIAILEEKLSLERKTLANRKSG